MNETNALYLIYASPNSFVSFYNIHYIISSLGELDNSTLLKIYEKLSSNKSYSNTSSNIPSNINSDSCINYDSHIHDNKAFGSFYDLTDIKTFIIECLKKFELQIGHMISVEEYNNGLSSIDNLNNSIEIFHNLGQKISVEEETSSTNSIFKKIFKG
ncbi:MAG: hypothetical protein HQK51_00640 [Oligoflexia bacterium]|nr:hypothetical protein [Oligoflexia bacterium]